MEGEMEVNDNHVSIKYCRACFVFLLYSAASRACFASGLLTLVTSWLPPLYS